MAEPDTAAEQPVQQKNNVTSILYIVVGIVILGLLALAFSSSAPKWPQPGEPAPDFSVTLLDGTDLTLSDLRGKVIVLNFWASWCEPCQNEAPELQRAWEAAGSEAENTTAVAFLGITFQDAPQASQRFIDAFGITYPNGVDEKGQIGRAYGITGTPETFIVDQDGNVAWSRIGEVRAEELIEQIGRLRRE